MKTFHRPKPVRQGAKDKTRWRDLSMTHYVARRLSETSNGITMFRRTPKVKGKAAVKAAKRRKQRSTLKVAA